MLRESVVGDDEIVREASRRIERCNQATDRSVGLSKSAGRDLQLNLVIDPSIIGGLRVQIGDDVIDGSVATRLTELRLQLVS
jgi:F0F1-type ATP synthase delta subunit